MGLIFRISDGGTMWVPDGTESSYLAGGDYTLNPIQAGVSDAQTFMGGPGSGGLPGQEQILSQSRPRDAATYQVEPTFSGAFPDTRGGGASNLGVPSGEIMSASPYAAPATAALPPTLAASQAGAAAASQALTMASPWSSWAPVFGELSPQQQYSAMMTADMPNYAQPYYQQMASRQFDPTFGRFLLGGYGDQSTGLGTGSQFANWYGGLRPGDTMGRAMSQTPEAISAGWDFAKQFGATTPGGVGWEELAGANPGMAYAMQDPAAIQAMAQAKYYGGGGPTGGYAGRAVASTLGNIFNRWQAGQLKEGVTAPGGFIPYLGTLSNRWA
jgi:hypothetical protein